MEFNDKGEFVVTGVKTIYNLDNAVPCSKWVREEVKGVKTFDAPQLSSGCKVKQSGRGKLVEGALGYMLNDSNNVYKNDTSVALFSGAFSNANGLSVIPENFMKVVSLFTARKLIKKTWINQNDEYIKPNTDHPYYKQWNNDCVIYSLFNTASNQSSLRNIEYKNKTWQIVNEFCWLYPHYVKSISNENHNDAVYKDAKQYGKTRFVADLLTKITLSDDAQAVFDDASELWLSTFKYREAMHEEYPEYHLNAWDAGWYQIKKVIEVYNPEALKQFRILYNKLADRMRPLVYELGFLKQ